MMDLKDLEYGKQLDGDDGDILDLRPPDNFDMLKFMRGRKFFQSHIFSCSIGMLFSLITGFFIPDLLQPLVLTGESDSPKKALKRYWTTFHHLALWHYGDVWKDDSTAQKSIIDVRKMHRNIRKRMGGKLKSNQKALSQYDMGLVQVGFITNIVMYPEKFGLKCTRLDLEDYVYFWYGIGHLLGIKRCNNICAYGLPQALRFCKQVEDQVFNVHIFNPPKECLEMINNLQTAFELGKGSLRIKTISLPHIIKMLITYKNFFPLTLGDYIRYIIWKLIFILIIYCSWLKTLLNDSLEKALNLNVNEM